MNITAAERNNGFQVELNRKQPPRMYNLFKGPALWWSDDVNTLYITYPNGVVEYYSPYYLLWKPSFSSVQTIRRYYHFIGWL